jgi:ACR3 family arsenite efflux pump ArsB
VALPGCGLGVRLFRVIVPFAEVPLLLVLLRVMLGLRLLF